jgi:hypothetical protein
MTTPDGWTYGGDPAGNDADEVRMLLGDTDPTTPLLSDGELAYLLGRVQGIYGPTDRTVTPAETSSNLMVAAYGADLVARKFAGVSRVTAEGVSVDLSTITQSYTTVAAQLRAEYERQQSLDAEPIDSSVLLDQLDDDCGIRPLSFGMGQFDNPLAGRQDYAEGYHGWWDDVASGWGG